MHTGEGFLANPLWQGVGALAGIAAVALYVAVEIRRRDRRDESSGGGQERHWYTFDLATQDGEEAFYKALAKSISGAQESIYRSGRGFSRRRQEGSISDLVRAEEIALRNGVEITRIQLSGKVNEVWANAYADLVERYPEGLRVFAERGDSPLVNVAVIDAHGPSPVIQLLFEANEIVAGGPRHRGSAAVFLHGHSPLAVSLQSQFEDHVRSLQRMTADEVRGLSSPPLYFAYGSNISSRQMRDRCPSAQRIGIAHLYGWRRSFCVPAPHMSGLAAGIQRSDVESSYVVGVAYEMSSLDQQRLDDIERGGYRPQRVEIKVGGVHRDAYTHVPVQTVPEAVSEIPRSYLEVMISGAEENGLADFAEQLRDIASLLRD
ncbi:gamma-glutamylcyclotransferase family protein [Streptomyces sp. NPDC020801]|uniref:gamma-glutamylcyclotransferase family protein n=1 Tax=Streptomyces sp. NPDC020801 TaxID=3365093 RepID=UPI0037A6AC99